MVAGPRNPNSPTGPVTECARTPWGLVIKYQKHEDGYLYELAMPIERPQPFYPRPDLMKLFFSGYWIGCFEEDHINYLTMWIPWQDHDRIMPMGPPAFRLYTEADREEAKQLYDTWMDLAMKASEPAPNPERTDPIKWSDVQEAMRRGKEMHKND